MINLVVMLVFLSLSSFIRGEQGAQEALNLVVKDYKKNLNEISNEYSVHFTHKTLGGVFSTPNDYGDFSIELSLIGGVTPGDSWDKIIKDFKGFESFCIDGLPYAGLVVDLALQYGFDIELFFTPPVKLFDFSMQHVSFGLKWEITDVVYKNPKVGLSLRPYYSWSTVNIDGISEEKVVDLEKYKIKGELGVRGNIYGMDLLSGFKVSKEVEIYAGIGWMDVDFNLSLDADIEDEFFGSEEKEAKLSDDSAAIRALAGVFFLRGLLTGGLEANFYEGEFCYLVKLGVVF
jgi:hypothetical protein